MDYNPRCAIQVPFPWSFCLSICACRSQMRWSNTNADTRSWAGFVASHACQLRFEILHVKTSPFSHSAETGIQLRSS